MKRLILTLALIMAVFTASANSIRYFTRPQAARVASTLDAQSELMIYCGYEYELATYVIVSEVWTEPVNSKFYEVWLFGYDAYTGEEIYMPIDLGCIWLYNSFGNRMYSAAQMLRFRTTVTVPNFYWTMPPYNPFVRHYHDPYFNHMYTYHYDVHRYGWRPPMPPHGGPAPLPPYYMRTPSTPAYVHTRPFTPGVNYPHSASGHEYIPNTSRVTSGTRGTAVNNNKGNERTGDIRNSAGNAGTTNRNTANSSSNNGRGNANTSGRNESRSDTPTLSTDDGTKSRSSATNSSSSSSSRGSATTNSSNSNSRGSATTTSSSSSRNTTNSMTPVTTGDTKSSNAKTSTRGNATTGNSNSRGTSTSTGSRGTTTSSSSNNSRSSATSSSSSSRSTSTNNERTSKRTR